MADEASFDLILPFDTDDPQFVRGFEAGCLWGQLKSGEALRQTIHATNAEMAIRMCEATGRQFLAEDLDDTWVELHVAEGEDD